MQQAIISLGTHAELMEWCFSTPAPGPGSSNRGAVDLVNPARGLLRIARPTNKPLVSRHLDLECQSV